MAANVSVVFSAETGQFVANVNAATGSVSKQATAVADAKNKIVSALNEQLEAAKRNGASTEELTSIQMQSAMRLANVTENNATKVIASIDRMIAKQRQAATELKSLQAITNVQGDDSSPISNRMQASALIRAGSGTGSIRAAEAFASSIPAFNAIASIAFPIVGALAFADAIGKGVSALHEMYTTAEKLPQAVNEGFESLNEPLQLGLDNLRKTNDQLEITNDRLEHKPSQNGTALALDEARINADRLSDSARKAATDVAKLLQEERTGVFAQIFTGQGSTDDLSSQINQRMSRLAELQRQNREALNSPNDTPALQAGRENNINAAVAAFQKFVQDKRAQINGTVQSSIIGVGPIAYSKLYGDQRANNNILNGTEDLLNNVQDDTAERRRQDALTQSHQNDEDQRTRQTAAQEAARKALEQQKQAWKAADDARIQAGNDSATVEVNVWAQRVASLKQGSLAYIDAQNELTEKLAEARRQDTENQRKAAEQAQRDQRTQWSQMYDNYSSSAPRTASDNADFWAVRVLEATSTDNAMEAATKYSAALRDVAKAQEEAQRASERAIEAQAKSVQSYNETALAIQRQTGMISGSDHATQLANVHAQQYASQMAGLQSELARQQGLDPTSAGSINAQAAIDKANADRAIQVMQDTAVMAAQTWSSALKNANAEWVQDAQDSAFQVVALYKQAVDGFNSDVANKAVTGSGNFAGTFRGVGTSLATTGLRRAEAPIFGALGMGKPDGSRSNPFAVIGVGGTFGAGGSIIPGGTQQGIASLMSTASPAIGGTAQ